MAERTQGVANGTERARQLRRDASEPERVLWGHLRNRRLGGIKFRRQVPLGPYIVDFYAEQVGLVVEVDGAHHALQPGYDDLRTDWLRQQGIRVIRLSTADVLGNMQWALNAIQDACCEGTPSSGARTRHLLPVGEG